jgi:tetratricopeptide (TPR) repeat protein
VQARFDVVLSLLPLPGWMRDEAEKDLMLRHVDQALADAIAGGHTAVMARLQALKGQQWADEDLLVSAIAHADRSGDAMAQAFAAMRYGQYLGIRCQFEKSLSHTARAIDIAGLQGDQVQYAQLMAGTGRCWFSRAGRLDQALRYADRAREIGDAYMDARLRAWRAAEAEPYMYKGLWDDVVRVAEEGLPGAWEIRDWTLILFTSAWLTVAHLKLGRKTDARRILDRTFQEVPARVLGFEAYAAAYRRIVLARLYLAEGDPEHALGAAREALSAAQRNGRSPL